MVGFVWVYSNISVAVEDISGHHEQLKGRVFRRQTHKFCQDSGKAKTGRNALSPLVWALFIDAPDLVRYESAQRQSFRMGDVLYAYLVWRPKQRG